jgi:hypothetical protein
MRDINDNSHALPGCDNKGRDVLFEEFDHAVDDELSDCVEE